MKMMMRFEGITETGHVRISADAGALILTYHVAELARLTLDIMGEGAIGHKKCSRKEMAIIRPSGRKPEVPEEHLHLEKEHNAHVGRNHRGEDGLVVRIHLRVHHHLLHHRLCIHHRVEVGEGVYDLLPM